MSSCDLRQWAEMFAVCVRLQSASSNLSRILKNKGLEEGQVENLKWAGDLVGGVDWEGEAYQTSRFPSTIAAAIRPHFYRAFIEIGYDPTKEFLDRLYQTLKSGFQTPLLETREIGLASELMKKMSSYILSKLQIHMGGV